MVGFLMLEKYVFPFFSRIVVTKLILTGPPNKYSIILPLLVSIFTPPALFLTIAINIRSGIYSKYFLISGLSFKNYKNGSRVAGKANNNSPFSLNFKLSP